MMMGARISQDVGRLIRRLEDVVWDGGAPATARDADGFSFGVDGVVVRVRARERAARLECDLAGALPADEAAARRLLARCLPYVDEGPGLAVAEDGRVVLAEDIATDADGEVALARFVDSALHWARVIAGLAEGPMRLPRALALSMIIP